MKKLVVCFVLAVFALCMGPRPVLAQGVYVRGYVRGDGTYVQPHWRSVPDHSPYNNWGYPGNINPFTGRTAGGNADAYLYRYYNRPAYYPVPSYRPVYVPGYIRCNGTYVSPYWRGR